MCASASQGDTSRDPTRAAAPRKRRDDQRGWPMTVVRKRVGILRRRRENICLQRGTFAQNRRAGQAYRTGARKSAPITPRWQRARFVRARGPSTCLEWLDESRRMRTEARRSPSDGFRPSAHGLFRRAAHTRIVTVPYAAQTSTRSGRGLLRLRVRRAYRCLEHIPAFDHIVASAAPHACGVRQLRIAFFSRDRAHPRTRAPLCRLHVAVGFASRLWCACRASLSSHTPHASRMSCTYTLPTNATSPSPCPYSPLVSVLLSCTTTRNRDPHRGVSVCQSRCRDSAHSKQTCIRTNVQAPGDTTRVVTASVTVRYSLQTAAPSPHRGRS